MPDGASGDGNLAHCPREGKWDRLGVAKSTQVVGLWAMGMLAGPLPSIRVNLLFLGVVSSLPPHGATDLGCRAQAEHPAPSPGLAGLLSLNQFFLSSWEPPPISFPATPSLAS